MLWKALPRVYFSTPSQRVTRKSDLPKPACLRIDKVTTKTMLWTKEQTEVAKRLVLEFEKGLSQGNALKDLLDRYDRPRRAAKAIRREMIAKRSRGWHIRRRIRNSLCYLAIASYVGLGVYYALGTPVQRVDYLAKLNERAAAVPEEDRAWPVYREVLLELAWDEFLAIQRAAGDYDYPDPEAEGWDDVVLYLEAHQEEIARLRVAAEMPGLGFVLKHQYDDEDLALFYPKGFDEERDSPGGASDRLLKDVMLKHLSFLRLAGRLLNYDAMAAAERGDAAACTADLIAIMRMARFADEHPFGLCELVRISLYWMANETIGRLVIEYPEFFSNAQLVALSNETASNIPIEFDMSGERMLFDEFLQNNFTDNGHGNGHFVVSKFPENYGPLRMSYREEGPRWWERMFWYGASPLTISYLPSRQEMHDFYYVYANKVDGAFSTPMRDLPDIELHEAYVEISDPPLHRYRFLMILELFWLTDTPRQSVERYQGVAECVVLGLALERYRLRHGGYPETLDALVPDFVEELPVDRMNGEALLYRKSDAGPVIYSVGSDGDDDGGFLPASYGWEYVEDAAHLEPGERVFPRERIEVWEGQPELAARWNDDDPADGDWILWPLHDPPLMPEPVDGKRLVR